MSKKCVATLGHESTVTSIDISEDGWTLLTAGRDKARLNFFSLSSLFFFQFLVPKFFCLSGVYHLLCRSATCTCFLWCFFFPLFKCFFLLFYVWLHFYSYWFCNQYSLILLCNTNATKMRSKLIGLKEFCKCSLSWPATKITRLTRFLIL